MPRSIPKRHEVNPKDNNMKAIPFWRTRLFLVTVLPLAFLSCNDTDYHRGEMQRRVILPANEVHEGWYFGAGDQVIIEGTVNGDAYVAGGVVEISGTINGDLLVVGGQVTVSGKVTDDVRAGGGSVRFDGKVGKSITAAGGTITVGKSAEIGGYALLAGGAIQLGGKIMRSARVAAGEFSISGSVDKNVEFMGGELYVLEGAKIGGDLNALVRDTTCVEIASGTVLGRTELGMTERKPTRGTFWFKAFLFFSLLATGLVAILVFPKQFNGVGRNILDAPGKSILWGIVIVVAAPVMIVLLCITVVGIPLAGWASAVLLWFSYLSQLTLGIAVGQRFFGLKVEGRWSMFWKFAVGLMIVYVLMFVPYLWQLLMVISLLFGIGAIAMVVRDQVQKVRAA